MFRTMLLAITASLLSCPSIAQVAPALVPAKVVTLAKPLPDSNRDDVVDVSAAGATRYGVPSKGIWILRRELPAYTYWLKGYVPPVLDASILTAKSPVGEVFLQNDKLGAGFNAYAGLGTLYAAPTGFRTDVGTGLKRLGLFDGNHDEVILQGRATDVFSVTVNGRRYANGELTGFTQIPGKFFDTSRWLGLVAGIAIEQRVRLEGAALRFDVDLTNRTLAPVTLGYLRAVDPDQSDLFETINTAVAGGVESQLQGKGGTFYLRDIAGRATIATTSYSKPADIGAALATGRTLKGDYVVQLLFAHVTLAPGQSVTHSFEMGVR